MTIDELMKLVNAGFTKAEIMALGGNIEEAPKGNESNPTGLPRKPSSPDLIRDFKEEESPKEEEPPKATNVNFAPMMTDAQIEKLAQMLNRGNASIDLPKQKSANEILSEHFISLMNGGNEKGVDR